MKSLLLSLSVLLSLSIQGQNIIGTIVDEGVVEPSGKTQRQGVDIGLRYQITEGVFFNGDANYTLARSLEGEQGQNYIPLAPDFTTTGGVSFQRGSWTGSYKFRYLKSRPANEDNSIIAKGYFFNDANG